MVFLKVSKSMIFGKIDWWASAKSHSLAHVNRFNL